MPANSGSQFGARSLTSWLVSRGSATSHGVVQMVPSDSSATAPAGSVTISTVSLEDLLGVAQPATAAATRKDATKTNGDPARPGREEAWDISRKPPTTKRSATLSRTADARQAAWQTPGTIRLTG